MTTCKIEKPFMKITFGKLLDSLAEKYPDREAVKYIDRDYRRTWREFDLVEPPKDAPVYRREITWKEFDEQSNRVANLLMSRGMGRGQKVAILLMNCLE